MRQLILALLASACAAGMAAAAAAERGSNPAPAPVPATTTATTTTVADDPVSEHLYIVRIVRLRRLTWRWQRMMGVPPTPATLGHLGARDKDVLRAVAAKWRRLEATASRRAHNPPHRQAWLCIHRYEASWYDAGAPYYGGLQMDWGFMARYGGRLLRAKGPAGNWTPLEQMWVAERAYRSGRGFSPWPNTARYCGLI